MAITYIRVYQPNYGGGTTNDPLDVQLNGKSLTRTVSNKNYGIPSKLLSLQTVYSRYDATLITDTEYTISISYDSNFIGDKEVEPFISIQKYSDKEWVHGSNVTIESIVWNDNKTFVTIKFINHLSTWADTASMIIAFFAKEGSTPTETYTFKRNANIENATCNYENNENIDTTKAITITANEGYQFDGTSYPISYGDSTGYFTISSDKSTLTYSNLQANTSYEINTDIVATSTTPTVSYTFKRNANIENATCNYANNEDIDTTKAITITANEGYQFDGTSYPISYGDSTGYFTISSDKSTLTYGNLQANTSYEINTDIVANAIPVVTYKFLLEGNIINATCNYNNNDEIDTSKNVVITALEGYEFTGSYKIYYGENEGYFTVSADKKTLTYDKLTAGYNYIIKDDIQATQEGLHYFTLTGGLYNCTCNYTDGELVNSYKRLEITASDNMYFKDTFYITKGTEKVELIKNDDATMMYLELDGNYSYNIADNIYSTKATTKYKVHISGTITNATCNYADGEYISKLKPTLTITAKKGYEFKLNTYYLEEGATTVEFDINEDSTVLSYKLDNYEYYLEDTYNATKTTALASDFTHLYYVTKDQLNALAKQRFVTSGTTVVDYGTYITKLYYLPFVIGADYLDESENITLGYFTSTTKGTIINADTFVYDLPSITYEGKYKNVYDYKGISFEFNVPFFDKFELEPKYVVGHTLTFTIKFNVYSNKCSLYVSSDVAGGYIYNTDCTLGVDIPFINTDNKAVMNNMGVLNPNLSNNLIMTVYRNSPAGTVDEYGKEVNQYVTIGDVKGHALFDECTIISEVATDNELNIITNLLKSGVIIS